MSFKKSKKVLFINSWVIAFGIASLVSLWSQPADAALQRRIGHLHLSYTGATSCPVGLVLLNHIDILKPSVDYQLPCVGGGGPILTPWAVVVETSTTPDSLAADTLLSITNTDATNALNLTISLVDANGNVGTGCTANLTVPAHGTRLRSARTLFPSCPLYDLP
jgi:hypothetical protein